MIMLDIINILTKGNGINGFEIAAEILRKRLKILDSAAFKELIHNLLFLRMKTM